MLGRMAGAAVGAMFSKDRDGDPVKGALIGAATMFVARRLLPARIAGIGATLAAGYVAKKLADREMARQGEPAATRRPGRRSTSRRATATQADRSVPATSRSTKMPRQSRSSEPV